MATPFQVFSKRAQDVLGGIVRCICTGIKGLEILFAIYSLDEFPQFYNVLRDDMSRVGT